MLSIFWGLGGKLVDDSGKPVFFEGDNAKHMAAVYQWYHDMVAEGAMLPDVTTMDEASLRPFFYGGEVRPGEAVSSWGTSGTVLAPTAEPLVDPKLRAHTFCHVAPETWYVMGVVLSAGGAYAWYRDRLARVDEDSERANDLLAAEAASVARGAAGITFLPYLQGERTPHRDASIRAAFLGLSLAHTRAHLTRAVVEGVCFALRDSLEILRELGLAPDRLLVTGGGARSAFVRTLQSEVFGLPVCRVNREEGPAYGAALLGAVGAGAFADLPAAVGATLTRAALEQPDPAAAAEYEPVYDRYRASLPAAHAPDTITT
jgi:xylulokinase